MNINIPKLKDSDPAMAATFNKPIEAIESVLKSLDRNINAVTSGSAIIAKTVPVSEDCFLGALVYFDQDSSEFKPALSVINPESVSAGGIEVYKTANTVGMIISITGSRIGDILLGGRYTSTECMANCLQGSKPGMYYLSETQYGKASSEYSQTPQPVLVYIGSGDFVLNITNNSYANGHGTGIRGVLSESSFIRTEVSDNGILKIGTEDWDNIGDTRTPYAISSLTENHYRRTPVVTGIHGLGNIGVKHTDTGEYYIADNTYYTGKIIATEYNLNGVKRSQDNLYTYFVFPSARSSSMTISTRIHASESAFYRAGCWIDVVCNSSITADANVSLYKIEESNDYTDLPTESDSLLNTMIPIAVSKSGKLVTLSTSDTTTIEGPCTLIAKIDINNQATEDIYILRSGFTIEPDSRGQYATIERSNDNLISSGVAEVDIDKDDVVTITEDGFVRKASSKAQGMVAYGIALRPCTPGEVCEYTIFGVHNTNKLLAVGSTYFTGIDGSFVNASPGDPSFTQRIGRAVGPHTLIVDIEEAIL